MEILIFDLTLKLKIVQAGENLATKACFIQKSQFYCNLMTAAATLMPSICEFLLHFVMKFPETSSFLPSGLIFFFFLRCFHSHLVTPGPGNLLCA